MDRHPSADPSRGGDARNGPARIAGFPDIGGLSMPYVVRPRPRGIRARVAPLLGAAAVALFGLPAVAQAACPPTATTKAFSGFGDSSNYSLVSNGAFESGSAGWSLTRSSVVSGNESARVHGGADSKSLAISATGLAVSPAFCVSIEQPTFRF